MSPKRKWLFLILIFVVSLSVVGGAFIMWRGAKSISIADSGQTGSPAAGVNVTRQPDQVSDESALYDIRITPLSLTDQGVAIDSPFLIQPAVRIDRGRLESSISVKTGESFNIIDSSNNEGAYELNFEDPLVVNRVYNIVYSPEGKQPASFAFQTEPGFTIVSSTPGFAFDNDDEGSTDVPVNTGIEINFSAPPDENWKEYFNIDPPVNGNFSADGSKALFIPESLKYDTRYTVTIDGDLTDENGNPLDRTYKIVFNTERSDSHIRDVSLYDGVYENFLPGEDIIIRFLLSERYKTQEFTVDIYQLTDPAVFANYYEVNKNAVSGSLKLVESEAVTLFVPAESTTAPFDGYFSYPSPPEGYYLIHFSAGDLSLNKLVQVNRLSVYTLSISGDMCFWINDTSTGEPAVGASINKRNDRTVTGADGKALVHITSAEMSPVTIQYRDAPVFVYSAFAYEKPEISLAEKFYHYIYTDRDVYHANDSINVFGVIREVNSVYRLNASDEITLSLGDMETVPVKTDKYGGFSHTFPVEGMSGGDVIHVRINGEELMSAPVSFAEYNKDKYIINAETDRHVYFAGEKPEVNISVAAYDGAPAPGVEMELNTSMFLSLAQTVISDENGLASVSLTLKGDKSQAPYMNGVQIVTRGAEDYSQIYSAPFVVLNSDIMLEYETLPDKSIDFTSSAIDRDAIERAYISADADLYSPDMYRGDPVDLDFSLAIKEVKHTKEITGERYDYILSQTIPEYRYNTSESIIETRVLSTRNGKLAITGLPQSSGPETSYYGVVSYKDRNGREISFNIELSGYADPHAEGYTLELMKKSNALKLGETAVIRMNGDTSEDGRVLSVLTNDGILSADVNPPNNSPITFSEDCMYSVRVFGAYFDGKRVYPAQMPLTVRFDPSDQKLNVEIKPDKEQYEPGGEALLDITVTDQNGSPKQAIVNISIVDDAAFAVGTRFAMDFLDELYRSTAKYRPNFGIYTSYGKLTRTVAEEALDSGSGVVQNNIRKDFKDNPVFETVETDLSGKAKLSIKFTDAVTRWRVTSHAVSMDYFAGSGQSGIVASLPFYVDLILADEFVRGDHVNPVVKPHGAEYIYGESPVSYTYELKRGEETLLSEKISQAGAVSFDLGVLETGDYTLNVSATMGTFTGGADAYTDTLEKTFHVGNTGVRLNLRAVKTLSLEYPQMPAVAPIESPVNFSLYNADYAFILDILNEMLSQSAARTDQMAASAFAADYMSVDGENTRMSRLKDEIAWNNGIPEQLYGSGEPIYTARFAAAFPELIDKSLAGDYVRETLGMYDGGLPAPPSSNSAFELNRAAGYLLQAAISEAVLNEIDKQVEELKNSNDADSGMRKLLYTAAYCAIGADDKARSLFEPYAGSGDLELADTLTFYINTSLDPVAAEEYLITHVRNKYVSDVCERVNFIRKSGPLDELVTETRFNLDSGTETIRLEGLEAYSKSISSESFKSMIVKPVEGSVSLNISYSGRATDLLASQNIIGLEKTVSHVTGSDNLYDIVFNVTLPKDSPAGNYTIRDRVPGNMRFTRIINTVGDYTVNYLEKQLVDINVFYDGENPPGDIRYRVIKISPDDAVVERAYISRDFVVDHPWGASK
ncbi:MAG: Ig-like domain-containing protein [Clostridiales bacterium]|jgi:hypothetical protein|nr:Ig-like domain-containing protein [Clostridiales bacterium]